MATAAPVARALRDLPPRIVFFDGDCAFCDGRVRWLIERDPEARLRFAPLQGPTAAAVRAAFPERFPDDLDTLVYLRPDEHGRPDIRLRSAAVFEILQEVGGPASWLAWLRLLPRALTDRAYRIFARHRYRWFGRLDACPVPTPEQRARALP